MRNLFSSKIVIGIAAALVVVVVGYLAFFRPAPPYQLVTVERGSLVETVSLTGTTRPAQSVSLSFGTSGIISHTYAALGEQVYAGQVLAELIMNDLLAGLRQAQANVAQQRAKLQGLQSGSQPTDASATFIVAMRTAYLQSESAVLQYADTLFTNGASANPVITIRTESRNEALSIELERLIVGEKLKRWKEVVATLTPSSDTQAIEDVGKMGDDTVIFTADFFDHLGTITGELTPGNSGLSQDAITVHQTTINTAAQAMSAAASAEQTSYAAWASASQTIDAQTAAIESAEAGVDSARAKIRNAQIIAPMGGIVTLFDAKVGQLASPSTPLISLISNRGYDVDAGVSETDVGKLSVGNTVTMTLDAFPGETFAGSVYYIAPAETK